MGFVRALALGITMFSFVGIRAEEPLCSNPRTPTVGLRHFGAWISNVDSNVFDSRESIAAKLQALKDLGINEIYPVVWNKGTLLFQAPELQARWGKSPFFESKWEGRDLLKEVLDAAKPLGLKVYAWFESGLKIPEGMEAQQKHPDWFLKDLQGSSAAIEGGKRLARLNPRNAEVQKLYADMFRWVVEHYAVDGVQIDDHFGFTREWGYDSGTLAAFKKDTGLSPPRTIPGNHMGASHPLVKAWQPWMKWKSDRVTDFIGVIVDSVRSVKSDFKLHLAPHPHPWSQNVLGQDWPTWIKKGWVEDVIAQVYREGDANYSFELRNAGFVAAKKCVPIMVGVYAGQKDRLVPTEKVLWQVKIAHDFAFDGVAFFNAETVFKGTESPAERLAKIRGWLTPDR